MSSVQNISRHMFLVDTSRSRVTTNHWADLYEESGRCSSTSTEDVTPTSGLWFQNQVLPRRGNGYSRHLIKILTWGYNRDSPRHLCQPCIHQHWGEMRLTTCKQGWPTAKYPCRHNHHWMARWYERCSESFMTIPWTMWFTHCRGWTYPTWRSNHHSPRREEGLEQINQGHLGTSKCQYRARQCICILDWHQQRHQTTSRNIPTCQGHWPQEPRQPLKPTPPPEWPWQQMEADFMIFDESEYLVIINYYSKMPIVQKMPTSQCNSVKMITILKQVVCRTWNTRRDPIRQWIPVYKSPLYRIHKGLEH